MGDQYTYENSGASQLHSEVYQEKQYSYVLETNQGNSPSQLRFDLNAFRTSDRFTNPNEMFITIPIVMVAAADASNSGLAAGIGQLDYSMVFKNGAHQLINSMSVMIDNKECVSIVNNLQQYVSFKLNTSFSVDDVSCLGLSTLFAIDNATSWQYNAVGTAVPQGEGFSNNLLSPTFNSTLGSAASNKYGDASNFGAFQRSFATVRAGDANSKWNNVKTIANFQAESKNYITSTDATVATAYRVWYLTAQIRLKDICDLFDKLPLLRGFNCTLLINLNLGNCKITKTYSSATSRQSLGGSTSAIAGNVSCTGTALPFMVSTIGTDWNSTTATEVGVYSFGCYYGSVRASPVANQSYLNIPSHPSGTVARLYGPLITLQPERALAYLSESKKKLVVYKDVLYFFSPNISANSPFNLQLAPSLSNIKDVLVLPHLSSATLGIPEQQSPFDTCPATTSPLSISNFNVQISGKNLLQQNVLYDFEQFWYELYGCNAINGGQSSGLNSSLIGMVDFQNVYKYYYTNVARRLPSDTLGKSVAILGTNNNALAMDLHTWITVEKTMIIDVESGKIDELRV